MTSSSCGKLSKCLLLTPASVPAAIGTPIARACRMAISTCTRCSGPVRWRGPSVGTIAVPLSPPGTPGVFYRGMRTVAFDGLNSVKSA